MVKSESVEQGRIQIVYVYGIFDNVEPEVVCGPVYDARFDSSTS